MGFQKTCPDVGLCVYFKKTPHYRGDQAETAARLNVKLRLQTD